LAIAPNKAFSFYINIFCYDNITFQAPAPHSSGELYIRRLILYFQNCKAIIIRILKGYRLFSCPQQYYLMLGVCVKVIPALSLLLKITFDLQRSIRKITYIRTLCHKALPDRYPIITGIFDYS
jgi:hypothetical protein